MPLRIPPRFETSLADLIAMARDKRQRLRDLIREGPPALDRDKLATDIASATELGKAKAAGIVSMLMSLYRVIQDTPIEEFVEELCDAARTSRKIEAKEVDWGSFKQDFTALLSCDETFGLTAKALEIRQQHQHVYCTARILTDIRPVFGKNVEAVPAAAFVTHALRISSHDEGDFSDVKDFFVCLDGDDLRELRRLIDRALMKEASLKSLIQTSDVHYLELEGQS